MLQAARAKAGQALKNVGSKAGHALQEVGGKASKAILDAGERVANGTKVFIEHAKDAGAAAADAAAGLAGSALLLGLRSLRDLIYAPVLQCAYSFCTMWFWTALFGRLITSLTFGAPSESRAKRAALLRLEEAELGALGSPPLCTLLVAIFLVWTLRAEDNAVAEEGATRNAALATAAVGIQVLLLVHGRKLPRSYAGVAVRVAITLALDVAAVLLWQRAGSAIVGMEPPCATLEEAAKETIKNVAVFGGLAATSTVIPGVAAFATAVGGVASLNSLLEPLLGAGPLGVVLFIALLLRDRAVSSLLFRPFTLVVVPLREDARERAAAPPAPAAVAPAAAAAPAKPVIPAIATGGPIVTDPAHIGTPRDA